MDGDEKDALFPSPAEQIGLSPLSRDVSLVIRRNVLIDEYLFGGCSPRSSTSSLDKFPSRVSSTTDLIDIQPPVPEN